MGPQSSRKPRSAPPAAPTVAKPRKALAQITEPARARGSSAANPSLASQRIEEAPEPTKQGPLEGGNKGLTQWPRQLGKATSRTTIAVLPTAVNGTNGSSSALVRKKPTKALTTKASEDFDIFDVPLSDKELDAPQPRKPLRLGKADTTKHTSRKTAAIIQTTEANLHESDDSDTSRKRKRRGSMSSVSTVTLAPERKREKSLPQRSRKYSKNETSVRPGQVPAPEPSTANVLIDGQATVPAINKPQRTRQRTVPVLAPPAIEQGRSSPAILHGMLPERQRSKPNSLPDVVENLVVGDETMYDIPDALATPARAPQLANTGSVTPRQKALFSSILRDPSSDKTTSMPSISRLQLTDQNPPLRLETISRSKSDLTMSTQTRKTRLIDTLKHRVNSSEDEDEDEDEEDMTSDSWSQSGSVRRAVPVLREKERDEIQESSAEGHVIDPDAGPAMDSQTSQASSAFGARQKLTYAKTRSYLEESNPEDALLISMDLDDDLGLDFQKKDNISEEDEDPTGQVRAYHELKRRGQQYAFDSDMQMFIDDLSVKTGQTVRRSALLELSNKMVDEAFTSELLDSIWAQQFFRNTISNGDVIFDTATAVAIVFMLRNNPTPVVLDQISRTGILNSWMKLAENDTDIERLAKDRKMNMSRIARESVGSLRTKVLSSWTWTGPTPTKLSPQLITLKAMETLIVHSRKAGNADPFLGQDITSKLVDITLKLCQRERHGEDPGKNLLVIHVILSILESESLAVARQKERLWSGQILQQLADVIPIVFQQMAMPSVMLAVKLCMNLSNNRPEACVSFSGRAFVEPLVAFIIQKFDHIQSDRKQEDRAEIMESLILCLGAMINLAEFSENARVNTDDGKVSTETLVKIFLEGSERAAQVCPNQAVLNLPRTNPV